MGYPMTYKRYVNRNKLHKGDYQDAKMTNLNLDAMTGWMGDEVRSMQQRWRMMAGDLRRLEEDSVDENAVAAIIAARTGLDSDTVSAVLKEFFDV